MTRIEELNAMKGTQLIKEADKLGIKVKCDKARTKLSEAKAAVIDRILAFEAEQNVQPAPEMVDDEFTPEQLKEIDEAIASMHEDGTESTETDVNENTQAESENATEVNEDDQKHTPQETAETIAPTPKRGALIEWNGKSQNICAWAKELGISANTLYGRIYKLGWTVEKAFTTKGRKMAK